MQKTSIPCERGHRMHGTRVKLKTLESSRLDYIYTCQEMQANHRSGAKEFIYCIYVSTIYTVDTSTFPGASIPVLKLSIYIIHCIPT